MYRSMVRIRTFEERVAELITAGEVTTPCHLCIGQEAVAAGVCNNLKPEDTIWGGHRSHGHYLAKGANLRAAMAEILGRVTGCSGGRGGSMHLVWPEHGILGTVPIVAGTVPLAVGAALAAKLRRNDTVSVAFFGDGALEEGHVYESMNIAALHGLPVIFVCENNLYASHLHLSERRCKDALHEASGFHGIPGSTIDGNDVEEVCAIARDAVERARAGCGPTFLECKTFRWRGHVGPSWDSDVGVKRKDELKDWLPKDPIGRARSLLCQMGISSNDIDSVSRDAMEEVDSAVEFARNSPCPTAETVCDHVFAVPGGSDHA
jgi:pyruvate dehydrogenase E1 component alpha subunit